MKYDYAILHLESGIRKINTYVMLEKREKGKRKISVLIPIWAKDDDEIKHIDSDDLICEYEQAIIMYQKELELEPTGLSINMQIGRCYRKMGKFKKAEKYIQKTLKILTFYPKAHYELALLYEDMGKKEKALEHLKITLDIWKDADPEYKPAIEAREKWAEWYTNF